MLRRLLVLSLLIITRPTFADEERVGSLGARQHWHLHGLQSLDAGTILRLLSSDFAVQLAGHPQAQLADFLAVLEKRLLIGLKHFGFRDARVIVRADRSSQTIDIQVSEGSKFLSGNVIVTGVDRELAQKITASLTGSEIGEKDEPPKSDSLGKALEWVDPSSAAKESKKAVWKQGQPAPFDDVTLERFKHQITRIIEAAGFGAPKFTVSTVQRDQFADITIHVADLGPPSILRGIEVTGNWRDSDDEIADFLHVRLGEQLTGQRRMELNRLLWESGRFAEHKVEFKSTAIGEVLRISVVETKDAPRLNDELSPQTEALLKCRNWIVSGTGRNRDLVVTRAKGAASWEIVASRTGFFFALLQDDNPEDVPLHALILGADGVSLYEIAQQRKLLSIVSGSLLQLTFGMKANAKSDRRYWTNIGFRVSSRKDSEDQNPFHVQTSVDPSYFVALGSDPRVHVSWENQILSLITEHGLLRINAQTGEFLGFEGPEFRVQLVVDRFKSRRDQLVATTSKHLDCYDPDWPLHSVLEFLADSTAPSELCVHFDASLEKRREVLATQTWLKSIVDCSAVQTIDRYISEHISNSACQTDFQIPLSESPSVGIGQTIARIAIPIADELFPRESWPWTVCRETGFVLAGQSHHIGPEMQRVIQAGTMGPIGYCLVAELFARSNAKRPAAMFAQHGLDRLDRTAFRADCEQLFGNAWPYVIRLVRSLGKLDDAELNGVAQLISVSPESLHYIRNALDDKTDEDAHDALLAAFERLWDDQWRQQAESRLREIISAQSATARVPIEEKRTIGLSPFR